MQSESVCRLFGPLFAGYDVVERRAAGRPGRRPCVFSADWYVTLWLNALLANYSAADTSFDMCSMLTNKTRCLAAQVCVYDDSAKACSSCMDRNVYARSTHMPLRTSHDGDLRKSEQNSVPCSLRALLL